MVRGKLLNFVQFQNHGGITIVFVHGMAGQLRQFQPQIDFFKKTHNVFAMEFVGHGKSEVSPRTGDYATDEIILDFIELLNARVKGDLLLVCHSYGCTIGTRAAAGLKDRVRGLLFLGPKSSLTEKDKNGVKMLQSLPPLLLVLR